MYINLQAGHEGVTSGQTGAPGEKELTVRIRNRLSEILISKGFMLKLVDANFDKDPSRVEHFDLFLAIHGDADYAGQTGGGFVDFPDPEIDYATARSKEIKEAIESEYFKHSGIENHPERSNENTKFYYMWSALEAQTPCVIIELGEVQDPHDSVILADTDRVCNALARGICKAFNIPFDTAPPQVDLLKKCTELESEIEGLNSQIRSYQDFQKQLAIILGIENQPTTIIGEVTKFREVENVIYSLEKEVSNLQIDIEELKRDKLRLEGVNSELRQARDDLQIALEASEKKNTTITSSLNGCQTKLQNLIEQGVGKLVKTIKMGSYIIQFFKRG